MDLTPSMNIGVTSCWRHHNSGFWPYFTISTPSKFHGTAPTSPKWRRPYELRLEFEPWSPAEGRKEERKSIITTSVWWKFSRQLEYGKLRLSGNSGIAATVETLTREAEEVENHERNKQVTHFREAEGLHEPWPTRSVCVYVCVLGIPLKSSPHPTATQSEMNSLRR